MTDSLLPILPHADNAPICPIPEYLGYCISAHGEVWSCLEAPSGRIGKSWHKLKPILKKSRIPYFAVGLSKNHICRQLLIHTLVLTTFVGPCPPGVQCRHEDGNSLNNMLTNLSWGTPKKNCEDRSKHGRHLANIPRGDNHYAAKRARAGMFPPYVRFTPDQVREMRQLYQNGVT